MHMVMPDLNTPAGRALGIAFPPGQGCGDAGCHEQRGVRSGTGALGRMVGRS